MKWDDYKKFVELEKIRISKTKSEIKKSVPARDLLKEAYAKATEIGEYKPLNPIQQTVLQAKRKGALLQQSLYGDIPYVRKLIGKEERAVKPRSGVEGAVLGIPRLTRDIYALGKIGKLGRGIKYILGAGAFGAATADTEDPKGIAKSAATTAVLFKGIDIGFKTLPKGVQWAYTKLPVKAQASMAKLGQSIGTSLKKYTDITKAQFKRYGDIKVKQIETARFKQDMIKGLPEIADREALTFMIERTGVPKKLARPDIINSLRSSKRPILQDWANQLRGRYDAAKDAMFDTYKDTAFRKDYINRLWDIPKNKEKNVLNWFARRTKHQNKRVIKTVQEGINKFGLKPKTLDAAELISFYEGNVYVAMANENFIKAASKIKTTGVLRSGRIGKIKSIQRADRAPKDWITINHPAVNRALGHRNKAGKLVIRQSPIKVHPDIAEELKAILGTKNEHVIIRNLEAINAYAKHSTLALSLFHHVALTEAGIASGVNVPKVFLQSIRQMKRGESPILKEPKFKDGVRHGLQIGSPTDVYRNLVEKSLIGLNENLGKKVITKPLKFVTKPLEWVTKTNNRFLWDYLHPNLKLYGYEKLVQDALKIPRFKNVPVDQVKRSVAQLINDTFGGQSWELLSKSPQWRQSMHFAMLSPDWNLSTVRQFGSIFGSGGRSKIDNAIRQELGSEFWKMGAIVMFGGVNQLNKAFTKLHLGKARNMWENEPGRKTMLFIGKNPDGTNEYLRWGKQFREVPELFINPIEKTASKISPIVRAVKGQFFPDKWSKIPKTEGLENLKERALEATRIFTPYSVQNQLRQGEVNPLNFAFPISKGLTFYKAKEELTKALKSGNNEKIISTMRFVTENGHDTIKMLRTINRSLQKTKGTKDWKSATDIYIKLEKGSDKKKILLKLEKEGKLTESIKKKLLSIITEKKNAAEQYQKLGEHTLSQ